MKQIAERIFHETLATIDVRSALKRHVTRSGSCIGIQQVPRDGGSLDSYSRETLSVDLREYREIVAIAFGKAAYGMAEALSDVLAPQFRADGILVVPSPPPIAIPGWRTFVGGHPVPNETSFQAGAAILERLRRCDESSLIFFLISGGGSALIEQPVDPSLRLTDFQQLNRVLVNCGAPIQQINVIRKHLSAIKGGRLAAAAPRSTKITLAISDVPAGQEPSLASGPTVPDPSTVADAERIARETGMVGELPEGLGQFFEQHRLIETPKKNDPVFDKSSFFVLLDGHDLLHHAHRAAEAAGFISVCDNSTDDWPLERAADHLLTQLAAQSRANSSNPVAIIAGGEVSSPVTGDGVGGRNCAFVLQCISKLAKQPLPVREIAVLSAGTDGIDGNSPAAGAVADMQTIARARHEGMDADEFLRRSDSYHFFERLHDAIITGPTGNNVRDLRILLAERSVRQSTEKGVTR